MNLSTTDTVWNADTTSTVPGHMYQPAGQLVSKNVKFFTYLSCKYYFCVVIQEVCIFHIFLFVYTGVYWFVNDSSTLHKSIQYIDSFYNWIEEVLLDIGMAGGKQRSTALNAK